MKLPQGKIPPNTLKDILDVLRITDKRVIVGPKEGFDSAVIDIFEDRYLVLSNDPSLFIPERIPEDLFAFGVVHWSSSDVAVFGAKPRWMLYSLLLPIGIEEELVKKISMLIYKEARKLNVDIIGGHTGVYKSILSPVASSTVIGEVKKDYLVLPSGAKNGDYIILTKWLGLEFAVAISYQDPEKTENTVGTKYLKEFKKSYRMLTVVKEAIGLADKRLPNAMHDITEGGFLVALKEMAENSGLGFTIYEENLLPPSPLIELLEEFRINPLTVSSSGCLLAAVSKEKIDDVEKVLRKMDIPFTIVGNFTKEGFVLVKKSGEKVKVGDIKEDDFARYFS